MPPYMCIWELNTSPLQEQHGRSTNSLSLELTNPPLPKKFYLLGKTPGLSVDVFAYIMVPWSFLIEYSWDIFPFSFFIYFWEYNYNISFHFLLPNTLIFPPQLTFKFMASLYSLIALAFIHVHTYTLYIVCSVTIMLFVCMFGGITIWH